MAGTAVKYDGPHARVFVDVPAGKRIESVDIARGETKTLPADLAARLLKQGDWSTPAPKRTAPAKPAAKTVTTKTEPASADAEKREEK